MSDNAIPTGRALAIADIGAKNFDAAIQRHALPWVPPAPSTRGRDFDTDDIVALVVFGSLTDAGFTPKVAGGICASLRTGMRLEPREPVMRICPNKGGGYIVTPRNDGKAIAVVIDVRQLRRRVRRLVAEGLTAEQERLDRKSPDTQR